MPQQAAGHHRRRLPVICCCAFVAALFWRAPLDGSRDRALRDNDCLYHLAKVERCLADYPRVPTIDRYSHYPTLYRDHWLTPHTLLYATIARVTGADGADRAALASRVSWLPPLLGALAALLAVLIAAEADPRTPTLVIAALMAVFTRTAMPLFSYGTIDHHLFAALGLECLLLARLRRLRWLWCLGFLALFAATPAASVYASLFLGLLFLTETAVASRREHDVNPPREWQWFLAPAAACLAALLCHRGLDPDPLPWSALESTTMSLFQVLWFLVLGGGMAGSLEVLRRTRRRNQGRQQALIAVAIAGIAVAAAALVLLQLTGQLGTVWARFNAARRMPVSEEMRPLAGAFMTIPYWPKLLVLVTVATAAKLVAALRSHSKTDPAFLYAALTGMLAFGFLEYRFLFATSMLAAVAVALASTAVVGALRRNPRLQSPAARHVPAAILALLFVPVAWTDIGTRVLKITAAAPAAPGNPNAAASEMLEWLAVNTPQPGPRHGATPEYGVFAPWALGHHINVLAERPVVVDPFNHVGVMEPSRNVWLEHDDAELLATLRGHRARYLVVQDAARDILSMVGLTGGDVSHLLAMHEALPGEWLFLQPMTQFAAFRLATTCGVSPPAAHMQPRFFSAARRTINMVSADGQVRTVSRPAVQVYETKPGALLQGTLPEGSGHAILACQLHWTSGEHEPLTIEARINADTEGRFQRRIALPAPVTETSFTIPVSYRLTAGQSQAQITITQHAVDTGETIQVQWQEP